MSTKNLARTVIEGGRRRHSKYLRRVGLRYLRVDNHRLCLALRNDPEGWDDADLPSRVREWGDIEHADKTNPCDRFLASRAGRRWDDVRSEICRRFDRRKLAGMHVTNEHLLNRVQLPDDTYPRIWSWRWYGPKFWVDDEGILHHNPDARY